MESIDARPGGLDVVVDVDVHLYEDVSRLARYAEGTLKHVLSEYPGVERWIDAPGYSPLTVYDPALGEDLGREVHVARTADQLRADLDRRGIDAAILYSGRFLGIATRAEPAYPLALAQAFNRYLIEEWVDPGRGIYGALLVAPQDAKGSAGEIERHAHASGVAAICLPMAGVYPLWGHRQYDPIYAAAAEADLPVVLQGYTLVHSVFPYQLEQFDTALAKQMIAKPFGAMANFASLVTGGALTRHPRLKVVFTECGLSWLPFMFWRFDQMSQWLRHELDSEPGALSEQVRRQIYVTTHRLEVSRDIQTLTALVQELGIEHVLFATDWPHFDADDPDRVLSLPWPVEWKRRILSENARTIFRMAAMATRRKH